MEIKLLKITLKLDMPVDFSMLLKAFPIFLHCGENELKNFQFGGLSGGDVNRSTTNRGNVSHQLINSSRRNFFFFYSIVKKYISIWKTKQIFAHQLKNIR